MAHPRSAKASRFTLGILSLLAISVLGAAPAQRCDPIGPIGPSARCGNGAIDLGEECDGAQLAGQQCTSPDINARTRGLFFDAFAGGTLKCDPKTCTFDVSGCKLPTCGDGRIEGGEQCEPAKALDVTCTSFYGPEYTGTLRCSPRTCRYDISDCKLATCGNGRIDEREQCEGADTGSTLCVHAPSSDFADLQDAGFEVAASKPGCTANCQFDFRKCWSAYGSCGNGVLEKRFEQCDGQPVGCQEYAANFMKRQHGVDIAPDYFSGGTLPCNPKTCVVDGLPSVHCVRNNRCGNGVLEPQYDEECDGADFGNLTCQSQGFQGGQPRCSTDCRINIYAGCTGCKLVGGRTVGLVCL
jgi:hypothetical protein